MGNIPKNRDRDDLFEEFTKHARKLTIVLKSASSNTDGSSMGEMRRDKKKKICLVNEKSGVLSPIFFIFFFFFTWSVEVPGGFKFSPLLHKCQKQKSLCDEIGTRRTKSFLYSFPKICIDVWYITLTNLIF